VTARAENHDRDNPDIDDTIARLRAYEHTGADVLFAPGLDSLEQIRAVAMGIDRPLNVLAIPGLSLREVADAGAQRVSVGGRLAWTAVGAMAEAARRIRDHGDFSGLRGPGEAGGWLST
jgi:2-methylisocitrate lyase-like PEP mutase family enzyme